MISIFTTKIRVRKSNDLDSVLKSKISAVLSGEAVTMFPQLARFSDFGFLLLRLMVGVVFITSGWNDLKDPEKRSKSLGFGKGFTIFLGVAEVAGGLGIMFGVLTQLAALGLIVIGLGAIQRKIFVGTPDSGARRVRMAHDLMLLVMSLAIVFTGGGRVLLQ